MKVGEPTLLNPNSYNNQEQILDVLKINLGIGNKNVMFTYEWTNLLNLPRMYILYHSEIEWLQANIFYFGSTYILVFFVNLNLWGRIFFMITEHRSFNNTLSATSLSKEKSQTLIEPLLIQYEVWYHKEVKLICQIKYKVISYEF